MKHIALTSLLLLGLSTPVSAQVPAIEPVVPLHGAAMHGTAKYGPDCNAFNDKLENKNNRVLQRLKNADFLRERNTIEFKSKVNILFQWVEGYMDNHNHFENLTREDQLRKDCL